MKTKITLAVLMTLTLFAFNNCGKGTTTGNPLVDVRIDNYNAAALEKASKFEPMSVQTLNICFKRLRLKKVLDDDEEDNVDFHLREVSLSPSGTKLTSIEVPDGTYDRVEFDLDDACGSGRSVHLLNANGVFWTDEHITIRFDGNFTVEGGSGLLDLDIQAIVTALNAVSANSQIRSQAESAKGSF